MSMGAPAVAVSSAPRSTPRKPRWLTFFAIVAIAIGVLRAWQMVSLVVVPPLLGVQQRWIDGMMPAGQASDAIRQVQRENVRHMREVFDRYLPTIRVLAVGDVLTALALIAGGIGALSLRRWARLSLVAGFVLTLVLSVGTGGQVLELECDLLATTHSSVQRSMEATGTPPSAGLRAVDLFGGIAASVRLIVEQLLMVVAIGLSGAGLMYFTRSNVRRLFGGAGPP